MSQEAATLLGLLADPDRLRAVAALVLGARTAAEVAEAAGLEVPRAGKALSRIAGAGLADQEGDGYVLRPERFGEALRTIIAARAGDEGAEPAGSASGLGPEAERVLRIFLRDGRLTQIPAARAKRTVVLDFLAGLFEPGEAYPERAVNEKLAAYHPDVAALRRYLVDEDFLHRRDGFYWRSGGTFPV